MTKITVTNETNNTPIPRVPIKLYFVDTLMDEVSAYTNQHGVAEFPGTSGEVIIYVAGKTEYKGQLSDNISISINKQIHRDATNQSLRGIAGGSMAYANMQTDFVWVNGEKIETCSEGYIVNLHEWSEDFTFALAEKENITLTDEHWEVILYLRNFYNEKHIQCTVRDMIKHFRKAWGKEKGSNKYLHQLFLKGGPQKQGNRLAGLLRTKGEH